MSDTFKEIVGNLNIYNKHTSEGRPRNFKAFIVDSVRSDSDGNFAGCSEIESYDGSRGWSFGFAVPEGLTVEVGDVGVVGIDGFNHIGFIFINRTVVKNFTTEDYEREHQEFLDDWDRRKRETLEANRAVWEARESYLSKPLRERIQHFRENSEDDFDLEGWGYELVIAELADALVASNLEETDEIKAMDAYSECSGNQFEIARALARFLLEQPGRSLAGTVGGLAPLTGKTFY